MNPCHDCEHCHKSSIYLAGKGAWIKHPTHYCDKYKFYVDPNDHKNCEYYLTKETTNNVRDS